MEIYAQTWVKATKTSTYAHRRDRVLAQTTFTKFAPDRSRQLFVRMLEQGIFNESWLMTVPVARTTADPAARTVTIERPPGSAVDLGALRSITTGPGYTAIRYAAPNRRQSPVLRIETESGLLAPLGSWSNAQGLGTSEQMLVFPALPSGIKKATLLYQAGAGSLELYTFPANRELSSSELEVSDWKTLSGGVEAIVTVSAHFMLEAAMIVSEGRNPLIRYPLSREFAGRDASGRERWRVYSDRAPGLDSAQHRIQLTVLRFSSPAVSVPLSLPN